MMEIDIRHMVPAFLLADKNGYAQAKMVEKALQIFFETLQKGLDTILDVEKMPEWRLDEMAWEYNIMWYDKNASVEVKRDVVRTRGEVYKYLGTKYAVENVIKTYFGDGFIKEWFEYDGTPGWFQVHSTNPALQEEKFKDFLYVIENVKRLSSVLEGVFIEMDAMFELSHGFALHEYGTDIYDFGM